MRNTVTLAQFAKMSTADASALPADILALLLEDVALIKAGLTTHQDKLHAALDMKYGGRATVLRRNAGKDSGSVRVEDGDYVVTADLPKTVEWDNDGLADVERRLIESGEPPADYIKIKRTISESAYLGWPSSLREMVAEHRTVKTGKPTYKIAPRKAA